jgi:large subunit ribosomal protein L20
MPRVKRGTLHVKRRKNILAKTKGYKWGRKNLIKHAKVAIVKAGVHAYIDRRKKKRTNRGLWQIRISALTRELGLSYSRFMGQLKKHKIEMDRKVLSDLAMNNQNIMVAIVKEVAK